MGNYVFSVSSGDAWLSTNSLSLIAITTTRDKAIGLIREDAKRCGIELTDFDIQCLEDIWQTQGNEINYIIEMVKLNTLI